MTTQHTPGPWIYSAHKDNTNSRVSFSVGTACKEEHKFMNGSDIGRYTAQCSNSDALMSVNEAESNARLVAAAPELLQELKHAYKYMFGKKGRRVKSLINSIEGNVKQ